MQARSLRKDADGLRQIVRRLEARKAELERALALGAGVARRCKRDLDDT